MLLGGGLSYKLRSDRYRQLQELAADEAIRERQKEEEERARREKAAALDRLMGLLRSGFRPSIERPWETGAAAGESAGLRMHPRPVRPASLDVGTLWQTGQLKTPEEVEAEARARQRQEIEDWYVTHGLPEGFVRTGPTSVQALPSWQRPLTPEEREAERLLLEGRRLENERRQRELAAGGLPGAWVPVEGNIGADWATGKTVAVSPGGQGSFVPSPYIVGSHFFQPQVTFESEPDDVIYAKVRKAVRDLGLQDEIVGTGLNALVNVYKTQGGLPAVYMYLDRGIQDENSEIAKSLFGVVP